MENEQASKINTPDDPDAIPATSPAPDKGRSFSSSFPIIRKARQGCDIGNRNIPCKIHGVYFLQKLRSGFNGLDNMQAYTSVT